MRKKLFIFDVDGTLVNSYIAIQRSLNFALGKLGHPKVSYQRVKRSVGRGDKIFILNFFSPKDMARALKIYRDHHKKSLLTYSKLRPQARLLLKALKRRGSILGVASNRPSPFTDIILKKLGIKKYFGYILCADQIRSLKPNPKILNSIVKKFSLNKQESVFIGDMDIDLEAAQRAGIDAIFVKGGSSSLKSVAKYKDKKTVAHLSQILNLYSKSN